MILAFSLHSVRGKSSHNSSLIEFSSLSFSLFSGAYFASKEDEWCRCSDGRCLGASSGKNGRGSQWLPSLAITYSYQWKTKHLWYAVSSSIFIVFFVCFMSTVYEKCHIGLVETSSDHQCKIDWYLHWSSLPLHLPSSQVENRRTDWDFIFVKHKSSLSLYLADFVLGMVLVVLTGVSILHLTGRNVLIENSHF